MNNEPVLWWDGKDLTFKEKHFDQLIPLYVHPVKEPITDEEAFEIFSNEAMKDGKYDWKAGVKAILKKAQEK